MKKSLIIAVAIMALVSFGTVNSAQALIDPLSMTVVCTVAFVSLVAGDKVAHKDDTPKDQGQAQVEEKEAPSLKADPAVSAPSPG